MLTVFNIQRYSIHDGNGVRTNIFFKGCPLHCSWCNNPESIDPVPSIMFDERICHQFGECLKTLNGEIILENGKLVINRNLISDSTIYNNICPSKALIVSGQEKTIPQILLEIEKDIPFYNTSGGGVTLTGGEPLSQGPELIEFILKLKKKGIHVSAETSLHLPWSIIENYINLIDLFLADLKHLDNGKFEKYTGGNAALVMENFKKLDETGSKFIIRVPVIPDFNFSSEELFAIIDFAAGLNNATEINFIPFHTLAKEKYLMLGKEYTFGNHRNIEKNELKPYTEYAEQKKNIREICGKWEGKTLSERGHALMSPLNREIHDSGIIRAEGNLTSGDAHIAVNFEKILEIGLGGYLESLELMQVLLKDSDTRFFEKQDFYNALTIGIKAFQTFIRRFEKLSLELSECETNPVRQSELVTISKICSSISENPPAGFYEALQLTWFVQLMLQIESNGHSVSLGRMDQYLYSFYKNDLISGKINEDFTRELLENTWLKLLSINKIRSWSHTRYSAGGPLYQNVTIGGQTLEGKDAVNDLSFLILDTVGRMKLTQPNLSVRFHKNISNEFLNECVNVIGKGFGMPAFNNDEVVIPSLIDLGIKKEDAYNYSAIGCIEIAVPGKWGYRCTGMSFLNFMRVLLAAMNNGLDEMSGKTFQNGKGNFKDFHSFNELMMAWKEQVEFYTRATVEIDTAADLALEELVPDILCSAFVDDCITRGKTIKEGGSVYDFISGLQVGNC